MKRLKIKLAKDTKGKQFYQKANNFTKGQSKDKKDNPSRFYEDKIRLALTNFSLQYE
jgi:hypothetical protein